MLEEVCSAAANAAKQADELEVEHDELKGRLLSSLEALRLVRKERDVAVQARLTAERALSLSVEARDRDLKFISQLGGSLREMLSRYQLDLPAPVLFSEEVDA